MIGIRQHTGTFGENAMAERGGMYERVKGSGVWWVRWTDPDGRKRRELAGTRSAAEKLLSKRPTQKLESRELHESLRTGSVTFRELCEDAVVYSKAENGAKQTYELGLRIDQLIEVFGSRPADSIRKNEIVVWLAEQAQGRKWVPASRNRWQATFSLVFRVGMDNEKIARNPAARIRRKAEGNGRVRFLSDQEELRLRTVVMRRFPKFLPHLLLSLHTGLRMSEQYGLLWSQVDFERRQIHLDRTKNGDARTIPLNAVALSALTQMQTAENRPANRLVFPSPRTGNSLQGSRGWFSSALEEAKITGYSWHCNRHTFASRLVMAGVDLRTVAELLGHRTLQMVMRYSHLAAEHQAAAVDRLVDVGDKKDAKSDTESHRADTRKRA
jgi:site-specific recombinase XerD